MRPVNIHAAKTQFSKLVDRAAAGEEIIIAKSGRPVARLVPLQPTAPSDRPKRKLGGLAGKFVMPDNFDDPLPEDILRVLEGRD